MCERSLMPLPPSLMPLPRRREWALARERADGVLEYWTGEWSGDKPTTTPAATFAMRWHQPIDGAEIGGGLEAFTTTEVFDFHHQKEPADV